MFSHYFRTLLIPCTAVLSLMCLPAGAGSVAKPAKSLPPLPQKTSKTHFGKPSLNPNVLKDRPILFAVQEYRWGRNPRLDVLAEERKILFQVGPSRLYRINPDGSGRTRLPVGKLSVSYPAWSPDGTKILFTGCTRRYGNSNNPDDYEDGPAHLYTIKANGSGRRQLTYGTGEDSDSSWSPDGQCIAFQRDEETRDNSQGTAWTGIGIITPKGRTPRFLVKSFPASDWAIKFYEWSPDGRWLTVLMDDQTKSSTPPLYLFDRANGWNRRTIPWVRSFAWSPGGKHLYLYDGLRQARILNIDSGRFTPVSALVRNPRWLDEGRFMGIADPQAGEGVPENTLRFIGADGREQKRLTLQFGLQFPETRQPFEEENDGEARVAWIGDAKNGRLWHPVPHHPGRFLVQTIWHTSGGLYSYNYLADTQKGTVRLFQVGWFLGFSPDGRHLLRTNDPWVGPYKRGGWRVGPLEIDSTATGKRLRTLTGPLMDFNGVETYGMPSQRFYE